MSDKNTALPLEKERLTTKRIITLIIQGAIIGGGGILPGVSGGILCVAFGLYMPLMQFFANPIKEIPKSWKKWMLVGIGGCLGLLLFAIVLDTLFEASENMSKSLFAGLIIGTFPSLFREAHNPPKGNKSKIYGRKANIISLAVSLLISMPLLVLLANIGTGLSIDPNIFWYGICGFIIGMGFVIPGLSSSPLLIFLGLLSPMLDGALDFDFSVIIPVCLGVVAAVLLLAKLMNFIFGRFYSIAFYAVIGVVVSSTFAIIPRKLSGMSEIFLCVAVAAVGLILSFALDKMLSRYEK